MKNYTRGQETFVNRIIITVTNIVRLLFFSFIVGITATCLYLYKELPTSFFDSQKHIYSLSRDILRKAGLTSLANTYEFFIQTSWKNFGLYKEFFLKSSSVGFWSGSIIFFTAMIYFIRRGSFMEDATHLRGSRLLSAREFNSQYKKNIKEQIWDLRKANFWKPRTGIKTRFHDYWGNPFVVGQDKIKLPEYALYRHMALMGSTGVGKTTLISSYIQYCRSLGEKGIIPDINGEYAEKFYRQGDIILSLSDKNTSYWDFCNEPIPKQMFAKFLVPSGSETNSFWWKGGQAVLSQLLERSTHAEELWKIINSPNKDLSSYLSGFTKKISGAEGTGQSSGIAASTVLDLGFLQNLNFWPKELQNQEAFSVYKWVNDNTDRWVFVTFTDSDKSTMGPLLKVWLNLAVIGLFERQNRHAPTLNIIIDELASVGKIELLPAAVERARKYRGKVILGYQTDSQLESVYGHEAESIKTNTGNKFIFRAPSSKEAKELSDFLGRAELAQPHLSTSYGLAASTDRENIGENIALSNVVLDSEIRSLPDGYFYLRSLHMNPVKSHVVYKHIATEHYKARFELPMTGEVNIQEKDQSISAHIENEDEKTLLLI